MLLCICVLIYLIALLVRMTKMVLDPTLTRDGATYLIWVENWIDTGSFFFSFFHRDDMVPPFSLWTIKVLTQSTGLNVEIAGRSISMFIGSMFPVIGFLFVLRLCRNIRIALLTAFLLIFQPDMVLYSSQPMRESCYVFFTGILLFALMEAIRESTVFKWMLCGVFLALSACCRFEALEFIAIIPAILAILFLFKKIRLKEMVLNASMFFLVFILSSVLLLGCADYDSRLIGRLMFFVNKFI